MNLTKTELKSFLQVHMILPISLEETNKIECAVQVGIIISLRINMKISPHRLQEINFYQINKFNWSSFSVPKDVEDHSIKKHLKNTFLSAKRFSSQRKLKQIKIQHIYNPKKISKHLNLQKLKRQIQKELKVVKKMKLFAS